MIPIIDSVPSRSFPIVNWSLIGANIFCFYLLLSYGPYAQEIVFRLGLVPARFYTHPGPAELSTIFTSMFLHGGWIHLASNMLALYIFGDNVEDSMGSIRYLVFYLTCGVIAACVHMHFNPTSTIPTIGASGAISGVLGAYLVLFPRARVLTLIPIFFFPWFFEIPAVFFLLIWFYSQLFNGTLAVVSGSSAFGGVAWWAHVGGFLAGVVLVFFFTAKRKKTRKVFADQYAPW